MRIRAVSAVLLVLSAFAPLRAQAPGDLLSKIVNDPAEPHVNGAKAALRDDPKVQGGKAL